MRIKGNLDDKSLENVSDIENQLVSQFKQEKKRFKDLILERQAKADEKVRNYREQIKEEIQQRFEQYKISTSKKLKEDLIKFKKESRKAFQITVEQKKQIISVILNEVFGL